MREVQRTESRSVLVKDAAVAHQAMQSLWTGVVKPTVLAGHPMVITVEKAGDERSLQQNAFYWGVVLKTISEQARIDGQQWAPEAWHNLFKRMFLGYAFRKEPVAGRRRKVVRKELRSTTRLSVKAMNVYLEKVLAFAATDLGVTFDSWWE